VTGSQANLGGGVVEEQRPLGRVPAPVDDVALAGLAGDDAWRLVNRLGGAERRAIVLAYFGGHSYRDVAGLLGLPEGTVKSRIRTGLARLRSDLSINSGGGV